MAGVSVPGSSKVSVLPIADFSSSTSEEEEELAVLNNDEEDLEMRIDARIPNVQPVVVLERLPAVYGNLTPSSPPKVVPPVSTGGVSGHSKYPSSSSKSHPNLGDCSVGGGGPETGSPVSGSVSANLGFLVTGISPVGSSSNTASSQPTPPCLQRLPKGTLASRRSSSLGPQLPWESQPRYSPAPNLGAIRPRSKSGESSSGRGIKPVSKPASK